MERKLAAVLLAAALTIAACGTDDGGTGDSEASALPTIVASTSIWADVVQNVACDGLAQVEAVVPSGGNPHDFEASLADRGRMENAALVIVNGLGLEENLEDTVDAVADAGTPVFAVAEYAGDGEDPHVWFDPRLVSAALPELADELVAVGLDKAAVEVCVESYQAELAAVDAEIVEILAGVPPEERKLVTNHDSLAYFADRYGFEVIGVVIPGTSSLAETNPAQLEELAALLVAEGVPAVFAEDQHSSSDAEALADHLSGVRVVTLHTGSLGESDDGADSYLALLRSNAERIASALSPAG